MNTPERPDHPDHADDAGAGAAGTSEEVGAAEEKGLSEPGAAAGAAGGDVPEAATGAAGGDVPRGAARAPADDVPEASDERPARRRTPVIVASVAAAVLLAGGGGAYLAATAGGGSGGRTEASAGGGGTPPPLSLDGYAAGGSTGGTNNGIAPGEPDPYGVTYRASGPLPGGPGSAAVYRPAGEVTRDEVTRLADALGVKGTPVAEGQTWRVGGKDGFGPSLRVNRQAPGSWTFERYAPGTDNCKKITVCAQDPADPAAAPVSVPVAKKAAAPVLKALGQDDAKIDASQVMGARRVVDADPVVGGLPTYGWATGLTVSRPGEVVGGSGLLKAPVKGDTYPVLSAEKTLELMNAAPRTDHRMGIGGCASPVPLKDRLEQPCGSSAPAAGPVTVEKAVFGLASHSVAGRQTLVPSWLFAVRGPGAQGAFTVTYPALDPQYLAPAATPSATPTPAPTSAPTTRDVHVDGYTAEGDELTVSFMGGVCADYGASAQEGADQVKVTVTETPWPDKVCILIAKEYVQTVHLDEPLGARKVVGSDGKAVPQLKPGARLPAPPSMAR